MNTPTKKAFILEEAGKYSLEKLNQILTDLKPYVWVAESYANESNTPTDTIVLVPKRRTFAEIRAFEGNEEYFETEIREAVKKWDLPLLEETDIGHWELFWHRFISINGYLKLPHIQYIKLVTKPIAYVGTVMDCLEYDLNLKRLGMGEPGSFEHMDSVREEPINLIIELDSYRDLD